jgi:hypothetical protein
MPIDTLTFAGARAITTQKVETAVAQGEPNPAMNASQVVAAQTKQRLEGKAVTAVPSGAPDLIVDLVSNAAGKVDIGDFQMIFVTILAVIIYLLEAGYGLASVSFSAQVTLPDIDTTLLSAFGLGQGAYLVKKAASKLGEG